MFLFKYTKKIRNSAALIILLLSVSACGGGSTPSKGVVDPETINGKAQKGAFLQDSVVTVYQLDANAGRGDKSISGKVSDDIGSFSVTPTWNDWTEVTVSGRFFNEDAAANSATELTLNGIVAAGTESTNVNLYTHFVVARLRQILSGANDLSIMEAVDQAQTELKAEMSLLSQDMGKLDISDGDSSAKNDNAILLLFSGGFMSNNGNATSLMALTDDFANNGKIDGSGFVFFQGIANYAGVEGNLQKLSDNLKQAGIGSPPSKEDLITLPKWVNQPPVINLRPRSTTIRKGATVRIDASDSVDPEGGSLDFNWTGEGTHGCENNSVCVIEGLDVGVYEISLTVSDISNSPTTDSALISVLPPENINSIPDTNITPEFITIKKGQSAIFDASSSQDADNDVLRFSWDGAGTDDCGNNVKCTVSNLDKGVYYITLSSDDNKGGISSAIARLEVTAGNVSPLADAGNDLTVRTDQSITLTGLGTDPDGEVVEYEWRHGASIIAISPTVTLGFLAEGVYEYTLVVTDNDGGTSSDTVRITVVTTENIPPIASAGGDIFITDGNDVTLSGSGTDLDGFIQSYQWFENSTLLGETDKITLSGLSQGAHRITLVVIDNDGGEGRDDLIVTVNPRVLNVDISASGCTVRQGQNYFVTLTLQGKETGSGTTILQRYEGADCTGNKIGGEVSLATTYELTNFQTNNSITTATMKVSNILGVETQVVIIENGNVVVP